MRVLILSQYYWPEGFYINDIADAISQSGAQVEVLTGKPNYPSGKVFDNYRASGCQREEHNGITIHRVPLIPRGNGGMRLALNYLSFVFSALFFGAYALRRKKFDVVFVYAPSPILQALPAIFLGWLKGCPVVLWVQDLWPESLSATGHVRNPSVLKAVERVVRFIYRHVDLLLVQSQAFVQPVTALAGGTPVVYHPNAAPDSFASADTRVQLPEVRALDAQFSVMFAGNIGTAQAVDVIVEAARLLKSQPDIQIVVLGDGSRRAWMLQQVEALGLTNLHLPGRFPVETMPGLMQKASALLVTLADQEIFRYTVPSKLQAYLAAGRPVLACLNGEGAQVVAAAGAGLTIPAEDGEGLAAAILKMYQMSEQDRQEMGQRASVYYREHFSHSMLVSRLSGLLRSCISQENRSAAVS